MLLYLEFCFFRLVCHQTCEPWLVCICSYLFCVWQHQPSIALTQFRFLACLGFVFPLWHHSRFKVQFCFSVTAAAEALKSRSCSTHLTRTMYSWGEDCHQVFWSKHSPVDRSAEDRVHQFNLSYLIRDLSAGHSVLSFIKTNGNAFIIRTNETKDGRRARGKQSEKQLLLFIMSFTL